MYDSFISSTSCLPCKVESVARASDNPTLSSSLNQAIWTHKTTCEHFNILSSFPQGSTQTRSKIKWLSWIWIRSFQSRKKPMTPNLLNAQTFLLLWSKISCIVYVIGFLVIKNEALWPSSWQRSLFSFNSTHLRILYGSIRQSGTLFDIPKTY